MRIAGYFLLVSAVLHVVGVALAGFAGETLILLVPTVFYVVLFAGLARGKMWVAWITFICMVIGSAGALSALFGGWPIPAWVFGGILAADVITALLLFVAIWAGPKPRDA